MRLVNEAGEDRTQRRIMAVVVAQDASILGAERHCCSSCRRRRRTIENC